MSNEIIHIDDNQSNEYTECKLHYCFFLDYNKVTMAIKISLSP